MRIALLTRNFSRTAGGAESYAIAIAQALSQRHEIHVFCQETDHPVQLAHYHLVWRPCKRPRWVNQIYYALSTWWHTRTGFDRVHSHEHVFHGQVQTLHVQPVSKGVSGNRRGWRWLWRWLGVLISPRRLTYLALEHARMRATRGRQLVFASPQLLNDFLPYYPHAANMAHVITPGVSVPQTHGLRTEWRTQMGWKPDEVALLFVANDYQRKGLDLVLQALCILPPAFHLTVLGQTRQLSNYTERIEKMGLTSRVRFVGPRSDVGEWMAGADTLVHPTLEDSFGMVVLEAMAHGLPVVVSPAPYCGLSAELKHLEQAWVLDNPHEAQALAMAVERIQTDRPMRERLIEAGRREAMGRSWAEAALKYEKVFSLSL